MTTTQQGRLTDSTRWTRDVAAAVTRSRGREAAAIANVSSALQQTSEQLLQTLVAVIRDSFEFPAHAITVAAGFVATGQVTRNAVGQFLEAVCPWVAQEYIGAAFDAQNYSPAGLSKAIGLEATSWLAVIWTAVERWEAKTQIGAIYVEAGFIPPTSTIERQFSHPVRQHLHGCGLRGSWKARRLYKATVKTFNAKVLKALGNR